MTSNYLFRILFCLYLLPFHILNGQERTIPVMNEKNARLIWEDEPIYREHLKKQGISDAVINKLIEEKIILLTSGRQIKWTTPVSLNFSNQNAHSAPSTDMGGENGWGAWQAQTGKYEDDISGGGPSKLMFDSIIAPTIPRFNLTSGNGIDMCSIVPNGNGPAIPVVAPGFGNTSLQLGEPRKNGMDGGCNLGCAEQIIYPLSVTTQDTNFTYTFAYIMDRAPHDTLDQAFIEFKILDSNGDTIPKSYQRYYSNNSHATFKANTMCLGAGFDTAFYKPWTTININLSNYVGQVVTAVITNVDCSQGGHYAYSYWDFACDTINTINSQNNYCKEYQDTICAPYANSYQWSTGETTQCINLNSLSKDTITVNVFNNCANYKIDYIKSSVSADFNFSINNDLVDFTDISTSNVTSIYSWVWSFNGGTPSFSSSQTPPTITYPTGTYTACLVSTNTDGCKDTTCKTISIIPTDLSYYYSSNSINVSPSFSSGLYQVSASLQNTIIQSIEVFDMVGKKIKDYNSASQFSNPIRIDLLSEKEGIYFLKINTNYSTIVKKVIKS